MKNLLRKGLLLLCAFMLAAAMTACGSGNSDDTKDKTEAEETTPEEDTSDENADTSGDEDYDLPGLNENGKFNTLDDFINSSIMQEQLEEQVVALEESGISCEITAEGDKLVYSYTLVDDSLTSSVDMSVLKESLDSSLEEQADIFAGVAASLPDAVEGIENPAVVVRYLDNTGTEITSREFPAE